MYLWEWHLQHRQCTQELIDKIVVEMRDMTTDKTSLLVRDYMIIVERREVAMTLTARVSLTVVSL